MLDEVNDQVLTPLRFLERSAAVFPAKTAVVDGDLRWTYAEFAGQVDRLARALLASGVTPGDRVAAMLPNSAEFLVAHYAVPRVGALLVSINTRLTAAEVGYILSHSNSRLLLLDGELAEHAAVVPAGVEVVSVGSAVPDAVGYSALLERADDGPVSFPEIGEQDPISVNYTSGTTGRPKGVVYTHRGAYLNALGEVMTSGFTSTSKYLWTLPMFHCNGWCTPWAITAVGGTHVCLRAVREEPIWSAIEHEGITHLNGSPPVLNLVAHSPFAVPLVRPVRITTAAAPPNPRTLVALHSMGFGLTHVYGLTETYGPYTVCEVQDEWAALPPAELAKKLSRQGVPMPHAGQLRVVDDAMNDVEPDGQTIGEIVMRGAGIMAGYLDDPDATERAFAGGWFHSGDLGVLHPDGYVEIRDRKKDIIISGGENISTVEVEQALLSHPAVAEAAVVGAPDEKWGERPVAFVVLAANNTVDRPVDNTATSEPTTADAVTTELIAHVRTSIAGYKVPREIHFLDELPKSSTGKITKFSLREQLR